MSDLFDDISLMPAVEEGSSARARASPARGTPSAGKGSNREAIKLEEYKGKRMAVVSDPQSVAATGTNPKVRSPKGHLCQLFYLDDPLGAKVCGCLIGAGNGIKRFCLGLVEEGKISCSIKAHANKPKAVTATPYTWFITTNVQGRSGGPAAVRHKFIKQSEAHPSFWVGFDEDKKTPEEWEVKFEKACLARSFGEEEAARLTASSAASKGDHLSFVTPRKANRPLELGQSPLSKDASWEGVSNVLLAGAPTFAAVDLSVLNSPVSSGGKDINVKRALGPYRRTFRH
jgi:hypothetical protein